MSSRRHVNQLRYFLSRGALFCALLVAAPAYGANFTVDSTADTPDATPGDGVCASSAGSCTLRASIDEANALVGADTVSLPSGKYLLWGGMLAITDDLTINGAGADRTTVSGNRKARVLSVASAAAVTLTNLKVQNGSDPLGGGVYNAGTLTLGDVMFSSNRAPNNGLGGGIYNDGTLQLTDVTFSRNYATGAAGSFGGGLYNHADATLSRVAFMSNRAGGCGGGVYNTGTLRMADVSLTRNRASNSGGGLFNETGSAQLSHATINANQAKLIGGGVFNYGDVSLGNATVDANRAADGGGLFNRYGTMTLTNVTVSRNRAGTGAGLYNDRVYDLGTVSLRNTILADNQPQNCTPDPLTSLGHNLDSGVSCALSGPGDRSATDPMLGGLRDNGGFTLTRALLSGSPAIDTGDNTGCPTTDQCGAARPADGNNDGVVECDIGALEVQPAGTN